MKQKELKLSGRDGGIAAVVWGPEDGDPVLALHGWLDNAASFAFLAPLLEGYRVFAVDWPGHGLSAHRAGGGPYHFSDWVADLHGIVEELGFDRVRLIGHSMGAAVSVLYAGAFPEKTRQMVLIDGAGPLLAVEGEGPQRMGKFAKVASRFDPRKVREFKSFEDAVRARVQAGVPPEAARVLMERSVEQTGGEGSPRFRLRTDARLLWPSPLRMAAWQVEEFLEAVRCPVLIASAEPKDSDEYRVYRSQYPEERVRKIRDLKTESFPGGHHFHLEMPDRLAPRILDFFNNYKE